MQQLNSLTIYLTEKCNFNCSYCYYKKASKDTLSPDQIKKGLRIFFDQIKDKEKYIYITIMGGEPLLEKNLLLKTIDMINEEQRKRKLKVETNMFTNGSLLDKKIAEDLDKKGVKICISIDGVKESNDEYRRFSDSEKSAYDAVTKRIKELDERIRSKIYVNMVFTPLTCEYINRSVQEISQLEVYSVDVSLATYDLWDEKSVKRLKKEMVGFIKYYVHLFSEDSKQAPFHMYQIKNLKDQNWRAGFGCTRIKLGPDGHFYFCDSFFALESEARKKHSIGDINNGINMKKRDAIIKSADKALRENFGSMYNLYRCQKRTICPYLVYTYAVIKNQDFKERLRHLNRISRIYSRTFLLIDHFLKDNKKYRELYEVSDDEYYEKYIRKIVR